MHVKLQHLRRPISLAALSLLLSSCNWVDSTGNQGESIDATSTEVFIEDQPFDGAIAINEQSVARVNVARQSVSSELTFAWSEEPIEQGNLEACADIDGFNAEFAADSFQQACQDGSECEYDFETLTTDDDSGLVQYELAIPALDAPVGVSHELSVSDENGESTVTQYNFCLIAINEAPLALDDTYTLVEGDTLVVDASSEDNLLANDQDDTDVTNQALAINTEPTRAPQFAENFALGNDGSFTYEASVNPSREDRSDSFDYELTDGSFSVTATATIRIVVVNQAPRLEFAFTPVLTTEAEAFSIDLSQNFVDPEGGPVSFSLSPNTPLVVGSGLSFSRAGVLSGTPTAADVGSYVLIVVASDGILDTQATLSVEVSPKPPQIGNVAPVFVNGSVFSQSVTLNTPISRVSPQFTDIDTLTYSMAGSRLLPTGVSLNTATGVISGSPQVRGVFGGLRVRATDPSGVSTLSSPFTLTVTIF